MKFTSDTDTIIKLQTLNNTINNLEKTYQGLLSEAKKIAEKQEKIVNKIDQIEELTLLIKTLGGYQELQNLLQQIKEISPFLKELETHKTSLENNLKNTQTQIEEYLPLDEKMVNKITNCQESINKIEKNIAKIGGYQSLETLLKNAINAKNELESFSQHLEQQMTEKITLNLTELSEKLSQKFPPQPPRENTLEKRVKNLEKKIDYLYTQQVDIEERLIENEEKQEENQETPNIKRDLLEINWDNILRKEPLINIIKKYTETHRIEKLFTTTTGQLVYGIKRSTIRIIIILHYQRAKSIILRDEDKRKELNLTPQEADFIYQYMDSFLQPPSL